MQIFFSTGSCKKKQGDKRKMTVWHKNDLPPHNVQVLNEYDCVVTYNHSTKTWKKANGRKTTPKVWRFRDKEIKE